MIEAEPDATMSREEIVAFLAALKKLRDGLDDFNCQLASIGGAGMRLGLLCEETAAACPAGSAPLPNQLAGLSQSLRLLGGEIGRVTPDIVLLADGIARGMRLLEIESRKGTH
jgi:hypothetical protein